MATFWDVVTGNSTLPVQAGTTFWDHIQNQKAGGTGVDRTFYTPFKSSIKESLSSKINEVLVSNVSGNQLSSKILTVIKSQVSR